MGFTLVELMITVAIVGIIAGLGVPSFLEIIRQNRASSAANDLVASLNLARSEAIKRGQTVTVCNSTDISSDTPSCADEISWDQGWLIFVDIDHDGIVDSGADTALKIGQPSSTGFSISETDDQTYFTFQPNGLILKNTDDDNTSGELVICVGTAKRTIHLGTTGRARIEKGTCS